MRKMVVFDIDGTLLQGRFIDACAKKYNFRQALALLRNIDSDPISLTQRVALFLQGKPMQELVRIADELPMGRDIMHITCELRERGYVVGLISDSYKMVADHLCKKIKADFCFSYELEHSNGIATGQVNIPSFFHFTKHSLCQHAVCKTHALQHACREYEVDISNCIVVGEGENNLCMISHAGVGTAAFSELLEYAP